ncbi:GntR family transcriptional regulator [Streptomyces heilongjiangensis]|nr:GntR family transcriptional regulator [Streptomyces heilongjiangensis]MDC2945669.1 GntR family transcriptional regulator [Streptomyces heilongjiangensis]
MWRRGGGKVRRCRHTSKGDLRPGARLPGERDLAAEYGVAHPKARRTTRELRERGLVVTVPAKGAFVAYPPEPKPDPTPEQKNLITVPSGLLLRLTPH